MDATDVLPKNYENAFGTPRVRKGFLDPEAPHDIENNIMLMSWDAIPRCDPDTCPINNICDYGKQGKCSLMSQYLKGVSLVIFRNYRNKLSEEQWIHVGLHLLPLYKGLCRMKMYELGLDVLVNVDDKGNRKMNPIFKEIREQIKTISAEWRALGLNEKGKKGDPSQDPLRHGDRSYYRTLEKQYEPKRSRLTKRRAL